MRIWCTMNSMTACRPGSGCFSRISGTLERKGSGGCGLSRTPLKGSRSDQHSGDDDGIAGQEEEKKQRLKPLERSREEQELIKQAKALLMDRNHMTEADAHRYLQKCSMDSGTNMVETAQMIMSLINR